MRIHRYLLPLLSALFMTSSFAAESAKGKKEDSACVEKCEKQKEACFGPYKKSDSQSGTYITPEGHKVCWDGFHQCKAACPKK